MKYDIIVELLLIKLKSFVTFQWGFRIKKKMIHSVDEEDGNRIQKLYVQRKNDLDILGEFANRELKNEVERLLDEQHLQLAEISQLKNERDMLFQLLQKRKMQEQQKLQNSLEKKINQSSQTILQKIQKRSFSHKIQFSQNPRIHQNSSVLCDLIKENQKIIPKLKFEHFNSVSICPQESLNQNTLKQDDICQTNSPILSTEMQNSFTISNEGMQTKPIYSTSSSQTTELKLPETKPIRRHVKIQASMRPKDVCEFSKTAFLNHLREYDIPLFEKASDVISSARSGDAILTYFTKLCAARISNDEQELSLLQNELVKLDNRNRSTVLNSIQSLKLAHQRECELRQALNDILKVPK